MRNIGIGIGLWTWSGGSGLPSFVADSLIVFDSGLGITLNGSTVYGWANQGRGGSAYDAVQGTTSRQPTYNSSDSDVNGRPTLAFSGTGGDDYLEAGTAALMKFLHDGTGCTVYMVLETATSATRILCATKDNSTGGPGIRCERNTSGADIVRIADAATSWVVTATSTDTRPDDTFHVATWRFEDGAATEFDIQVDGGTPDVFASSSPSNADAQGALRIGGTTDTAGALGGRLCALIIDDRVHSDVEVAAINAWLHGRFISSLPQFLRRNLIVFDSSEGVTLTGSNVSAWSNRGYGGSSYDLAQATAADRPAYTSSASGFGNRPALTFDGSSDYLSGATAALAKFMHAGNGATVYVVANAASGLATSQALVATKDSGSGEPGYRLMVTSAGNASCTVRNVGANIISLATSSDVSGSANLVSQRYEEGLSPESEIYAGGVEEDTTNSTAAPSSNDAQAELFVGRASNAAIYLEGDLAAVIIDNTRHDDTLRAQHESWLIGRFGL